jgi:hypothetical protein
MDLTVPVARYEFPISSAYTLASPKHQIEASGLQVLARLACINTWAHKNGLAHPGPAARHEHRARRATRTTIPSSSSSPCARTTPAAPP